MDSYSLGVREAEHGRPYLGNNLAVYPRVATTMLVVNKMIRMNRFFVMQPGARPPIHVLGPLRDGATVIAIEQTKGIGSNGRKWASPKGNVLFSRATQTHAGEFGQEMEMIAACAAAEIVQELLLASKQRQEKTVSIKYPNDILIDGVKVGGCLVPPIYDYNTLCNHKRFVNLGVGVNVKVAPVLAGGPPTTCLAAHEVTDLGIGRFIGKFENRFVEILTQYRTTRNFNIVLARMGFLDNDENMTLRRNGTTCSITGAYAGFRAERRDGKPTASILLRTGDNIAGYGVHDFHMISAPQRSAGLSRRAAAAAMGAHA